MSIVKDFRFRDEYVSLEVLTQTQHMRQNLRWQTAQNLVGKVVEQCCICYEREAIVMWPCSHLSCAQCMKISLMTSRRKCAVCRFPDSTGELLHDFEFGLLLLDSNQIDPQLIAASNLHVEPIEDISDDEESDNDDDDDEEPDNDDDDDEEPDYNDDESDDDWIVGDE